MDLLIDNNLIDQCQTWHNSIEPELEIHYSQHQYINPDWAPNNQLENYITPTQATSCSSAEINLDDYNQTEFEIVLETLFDDARIQLTEKSLRPIACGQPFLIMGAPGTLKYLQKYGFKTFEGIIDESYDSINDSKNRMQAVIDTMMTIAKWTSQERKDNLDKIKKMAIDEVKTIGEVYIMLKRRNFDGFFDRIDDGKELKNTDRSV